MAKYQIVNNIHDDRIYSISIVPTNKKISIPSSMPEYKNILPPIVFNHLIFEAAIYSNKPKIISKPILVIHVDDGYGVPKTDLEKLIHSRVVNRDEFLKPHISEVEFTTFILNIVSNENIINLSDDKASVYSKHGYVALRHDIWSIWFWQNINHIFLLRDLNWSNGV
jgi:hypothetical protein